MPDHKNEIFGECENYSKQGIGTSTRGNYYMKEGK
jgi:hypothetical protein